MSQDQEKLASRLSLVDGILEGAFFSPLHVHDWVGFCFGHPSLLGLEEEEMTDLFLRSALAAQTIYPEIIEGRAPLAWLWSLPEARPVLAHVLASLRADRPLLFHRLIFSLPAVSGGQVNPDDFELAEDFLQQALGEGLDLRQGAASELDTLRSRALQAAGQDPQRPNPSLAVLAQALLDRPEALEMRSEAELRMWLLVGDGLEGLDPDLAPGVMVEAWTRWVGAVTGARPDLSLLSRWLPILGLDANELLLYAPVERTQRHVISATCPFCAARISLALGSAIEQLGSCPHLLYVGTSDEVHLLEVVGRFDLGADFRALLASYYQSPADLDLFATIVNDLYEMLREQGRLEVTPVQCSSAPKAFYNLRAYFAGPARQEDTRH